MTRALAGLLVLSEVLGVLFVEQCTTRYNTTVFKPSRIKLYSAQRARWEIIMTVKTAPLLNTIEKTKSLDKARYNAG